VIRLAPRNRGRWLVVGLTGVLVALVVGTAPAAKDTLVVGLPADMPIFDAGQAASPRIGGILGQVAEPLVRLTRDGTVVPWLVEAWEPSTDGRGWTLHTRRGVTFTDGTRFDAEALRVNLERSRAHAAGRAALAMVTSMAVAGEHALDVTTDAPFAPLARSLGHQGLAVYSPTQLLEGDEDGGPAPPVGTGPFKLEPAARGHEVRLEANDRYWGGKPKLRAIVIRPYPDAEACIRALERGDVDLVPHLPPPEAARLAGNLALIVAPRPPALDGEDEPSMWAARGTLRGVEWDTPGPLPSLHAAFFED
jgi:ABC-type transport system substrate-binding protein